MAEGSEQTLPPWVIDDTAMKLLRAQRWTPMAYLSNTDALAAFEASCRGRVWTQEEAEQIRYMAALTSGPRADGERWNV